MVSGGMFRGADGGRRFCRFPAFPISALRQIRRAGVCCINRQLSNSIGTDSPFFWILGLSRFDVSPPNASFSRVCAPPPPTPLPRPLGGRAPRLSNFSGSGGLGSLGGDEPGGRRGAPIRRFSGFSGFRDSTSQISRAGVYSINRSLLKKFGRRLPENFRSRFSTLAFRQIRRAGVCCINRPLPNTLGRHLTEK